MRYWFRLWLLVVPLLPASGRLAAQPPILNAANGETIPIAESDASEALSNEAPSATKREEVADKLRVAQRTLDSAKETSEQANAKPPERLQREVELLKQLELVVSQEEAAKAEYTDLQRRVTDLEGELEAVRSSGPSEEPPYSFLLLDRLRDELRSRHSRTETIEVAGTSATEAVTRAKEHLEAKQHAHRLAKEVEQSNAVDDKKAELANATKFADLESQIAKETLDLRKQEQANQQFVLRLHQLQVELLEAKVKWIAPRAVFSDRDLQEQMIEIDKYEEDLRTDMRLAESDLQYAESEWSQVRHELDSSITKNPVLVKQVEAKQLVRQLHQIRVAQLTLRLQRRGANREMWQRRFQVIRESAETEELIAWRVEAQKRLDQLEREKRLGQMKIDEVREDLVTLDKDQQASSDEAVRRWLDSQRETLTQLIQVHDADIVSTEASRRLTEKLISEIDGDVEHWTLGEWFESAGHYVAKVWNMELTTVDDHPLTIGKVLVGVILLFCGFILSRLLSRTLGSRLQHERIGMNESGAAALQSLSFYVLLVTFTLTSLKFVNVPLTMFTFLGGAIAIGVGFGSQNVLNNFISGLILLAERPIKVGDLIEIDDLYGNVQQIGARSTIIRTGDNLDIIVPNSTFLEKNVVNLTLGNDKLRTCVKVGIAYGSPTREATRLMKLGASEHGRILNSPEPFVWFMDFGDNSLNFELHFWVKVRRMSDRMRIESDVRYRIDQLFREAGITIAFPQRDVHFNAAQPIPVRVVPGDEQTSLPNTSTTGAA